jgi:hypothetical protein
MDGAGGAAAIATSFSTLDLNPLQDSSRPMSALKFAIAPSETPLRASRPRAQWENARRGIA